MPQGLPLTFGTSKRIADRLAVLGYLFSIEPAQFPG